MKSQESTLISASDVAGNITSGEVDLRFNYGFVVVNTFTGSPTGSVIIQGSIDKSTWVQIASLTISGTTTLASNQDACYYPYVRVYKAAGGTGTMTSKINIKGA